MRSFAQKKQLARETIDLNKTLEDQERKMMEFFAKIKEEVAKLVPS